MVHETVSTGEEGLEPMRIAYLPIAVAVTGVLLYHVSQKSIPANVNPLFTLVLAYSVAIMLCLVFGALYGRGGSFVGSVRGANWAVFGVGVSTALVELGFLLAYRLGWNVRTAGPLVSVTTIVLLAPLGLILYGERIDARSVAGLLCCIVGILLISAR
jgi:uncharacterized membrane protein